MTRETVLWGIHGGRNGEAETLFEKESVFALGWNAIGDLSGLSTRQEFKNCYQQAYPTAGANTIPIHAGMLYNFVCKTKPGDFVVFPRKLKSGIRIGRVVGDYEFNPNFSFPHVRKVEWLDAIYPRSRFTKGALHEIGSAMTLFQIKKHRAEFLAALGEDQPQSQIPTSVIPDASVEESPDANSEQSRQTVVSTTVMETPKANPENLLSLMRDAHAAKVVIPEFQRSFIWGREDIEELLVSILQGYFIGTFLLLDTPSDKPMFPFRVVEGLEGVNNGINPQNYNTVRLVLDGQQRITSLFYVLYEPAIALKNTKNPYRFFLRLDLLLEGATDDAVYGISQADRRRMAEMDNLVYEHRAVPFSLMRDTSEFYRWFYSEQKFLRTAGQRKIIEGFFDRFQKFMVPVIGLSPEAGKDNIVNIFERINRTGVSLSLFDLAVARLYLKGVLLRELWESFSKENPDAAEVVKPEFLLKVIALQESKEPKKSTLLDVVDNIERQRFESWWKVATEYMAKAHKRMTAPQGGYGAYEQNWIPYTTLVVPLAVLLYFVEQRRGGEALYRMIDKWYWANVFTQRYDSAVDTKSFADTKDFIQWMETGTLPTWLQTLSVNNISLNIDEPRSAIYRGLMSRVVIRGAKDFITGQAANLKTCEDDHIFPRSKYGAHPSVNSILNRTLISPESNKLKSGLKPSEYLPLLLSKRNGDEGKLRETLESHFINDAALNAMRQDDIDSFLKAREAEFLKQLRTLLS